MKIRKRSDGWVIDLPNSYIESRKDNTPVMGRPIRKTIGPFLTRNLARKFRAILGAN